MCQTAITDIERAYATEHPTLAKLYYLLGNVYAAQHRRLDALRALRRALSIQEKVLGQEHSDVADTLSVLAFRYTASPATVADYTEAKKLLVRAVSIKEKLHKDDPSLAFDLDQLCTVYTELTNFTEAEETCLRAVAMIERIKGPRDPQVAVSLTHLAHCYSRQAKFAEAEPLYSRATSIDPSASSALFGLAGIYRHRGNYTESEKLHRRALHLRQTVFGSDSAPVVDILESYAGLLWKMGRTREATEIEDRIKKPYAGVVSNIQVSLLELEETVCAVLHLCPRKGRTVVLSSVSDLTRIVMSKEARERILEQLRHPLGYVSEANRLGTQVITGAPVEVANQLQRVLHDVLPRFEQVIGSDDWKSVASADETTKIVNALKDLRQQIDFIE